MFVTVSSLMITGFLAAMTAVVAAALVQ